MSLLSAVDCFLVVLEPPVPTLTVTITSSFVSSSEENASGPSSGWLASAAYFVV
jgi:hypothetical protein